MGRTMTSPSSGPSSTVTERGSLLQSIRDAAMVGGGQCNVGKALAAMDDQQRADLNHALWHRNEFEEYEYSARAISRGLMQHGFRVSDRSINRHRAKECRCDG